MSIIEYTSSYLKVYTLKSIELLNSYRFLFFTNSANDIYCGTAI